MRRKTTLLGVASMLLIGLAALANYVGFLDREAEPSKRPVTPATVEVVAPARSDRVASTEERGKGFKAAVREFSEARADVKSFEKGESPYRPTVESAGPVLIFDAGPSRMLSQNLEDHFPAYQLLASEVELPELGARLFFYRSVRSPAMSPAADFVSVYVEDDWLGMFVSDGRQQCAWMSADEMWVITDDFGIHPLLGSVEGAGWVSEQFAELFGSDGSGAIDWRGMPARGDQFDRQWQSQLHLVDPPARDGIVFRYEGGHRYAARPQRGRGNSAHHWNLLAYGLDTREADQFMIGASQCVLDLAAGRFPEAWVSRYLD